ncbi:MAG: hypothetical protein JF614_14470 [Acidobacteria bacterium]|nr:hypothetical protein [Acidobacteriota bacterium]
MSQQIRRVLAALGLMAALFVVCPAPSRAAGFQGVTALPGLGSLWAWLESLLPGPAGAAAPRPRAAGRAPAGPVGWAAASTTTTTTATSDQGSMIDPNGHK